MPHNQIIRRGMPVHFRDTAFRSSGSWPTVYFAVGQNAVLKGICSGARTHAHTHTHTPAKRENQNWRTACHALGIQHQSVTHQTKTFTLSAARTQVCGQELTGALENGLPTQTRSTRSSSREVRIRVFFSVVYFSNGPLPTKRRERALLGDLAVKRIFQNCTWGRQSPAQHLESNAAVSLGKKRSCQAPRIEKKWTRSVALPLVKRKNLRHEELN